MDNFVYLVLTDKVQQPPWRSLIFWMLRSQFVCHKSCCVGRFHKKLVDLFSKQVPPNNKCSFSQTSSIPQLRKSLIFLPPFMSSMTLIYKHYYSYARELHVHVDFTKLTIRSHIVLVVGCLTRYIYSQMSLFDIVILCSRYHVSD